MNDARQDPTTPSPRNAPPMTDRERLAALLYGSTYRDLPKPFSRFEALEMADALLAEGVTLPPEKAGPVTSAAAWARLQNARGLVDRLAGRRRLPVLPDAADQARGGCRRRRPQLPGGQG